MDNIRNFSIIAHIDHGKSTLADRLIQRCGGLSDREMSEQVLDSMDLERERGITIFAKQAMLTVGEREFTLLDTPGHVDFSAEMERTLSVLDYAVLVISGSDGVQSHTRTCSFGGRRHSGRGSTDGGQLLYGYRSGG